MVQLVCKRCGRKLKKTALNVERGYGSVCWEKEGRFRTESNESEISELKAMIKTLQKRIDALTISPVSQIPMPNQVDWTVPNGKVKTHSKIKINKGGWDVSELTTNDAFKMRAQTAEMSPEEFELFKKN